MLARVSVLKLLESTWVIPPIILEIPKGNFPMARLGAIPTLAQGHVAGKGVQAI